MICKEIFFLGSCVEHIDNLWLFLITFTIKYLAISTWEIQFLSFLKDLQFPSIQFVKINHGKPKLIKIASWFTAVLKILYIQVIHSSVPRLRYDSALSAVRVVFFFTAIYGLTAS